MTWAKLDDKVLQNPAIAATGGLGFAVHAAGIVYCAQQETNGFVPYGAARMLLNLDGVVVDGADAQCVAVIRDGVPGYQSLEAAGLWSWDEEKRGWWIRNFLKFNPSRDEAEAKRQDISRKRSEAGKRGAAKTHAKKQTGAVTSADEQDDDNGDFESWQTSGKPEDKNMAPVPYPDRQIDDQLSTGCVDPRYPKVLEAVAKRRMAGRVVRSTNGYLRKTIESVDSDDGQRIAHLLAEWPDAPADVIAAHAEGEQSSITNYPRRRGVADALDQGTAPGVLVAQGAEA